MVFICCKYASDNVKRGETCESLTKIGTVTDLSREMKKYI
jgi:hypothetical protein